MQSAAPAPSADPSATALRSPGIRRRRLLPTTQTEAQINPGLSLWLDEKRGVTSIFEQPRVTQTRYKKSDAELEAYL